MNAAVPFYKMSGGGNDFVLFDNRKAILAKDYSKIAQEVCQRKFSIGADGILVLEKSDQADFRMVYYNADGSRAEMCGNGARCIARYAHLLKAAPEKMKFLTDAGPIGAEIMGEESVKLNMGKPKDLKLDLTLKLEDGKQFNASFINTGVPHAVVLVTDLEKTDVQNLGKSIRFHKEFAPAGANVNFVFHKDPHHLVMRTFERGVEGETLACGTGATAAAVVCGVMKLVASPVECLTRGGETLKVYFEIEQASAGIAIHEVYLEGPAAICFKGELEI